MSKMALDDIDLNVTPNLEIKITGSDYEGMIDATTAAIVLAIQTKIYQMAALGLYGKREETRRLSSKVRKALLVKFNVKPGCTEILADVAPAFVEAIKPVFEKMTPEELYEFAKLFVFAFIGYGALAKITNAVKDHFDNKAQNEHEREILKNQAEALLVAAGKLGEEAAINVAKTTSGSTSVKFGRWAFSEQDLNEIRERAPRAKMSDYMLAKHYIVEKIDVKKRPVIYMELLQVPGEKNVKAQYTEDEQDVFYSDKTTASLCLAAAKGEPVLLSVIETVNSDGDLQKVTVLNVLEEADSNKN